MNEELVAIARDAVLDLGVSEKAAERFALAVAPHMEDFARKMATDRGADIRRVRYLDGGATMTRVGEENLAKLKKDEE